MFYRTHDLHDRFPWINITARSSADDGVGTTLNVPALRGKTNTSVGCLSLKDTGVRRTWMTEHRARLDPTGSEPIKDHSTVRTLRAASLDSGCFTASQVIYKTGNLLRK